MTERGDYNEGHLGDKIKEVWAEVRKEQIVSYAQSDYVEMESAENHERTAELGPQQKLK